MEIEISRVVVGKHRRPVGDTSELAASIRDIGLLNPITITGDNRLVAGLHRLRACESLGWSRITANMVQLDKLQAELAEIDENLIRNELTVLERGELLTRRKQIYEAAYPQTKHGGDRKSGEAKSKRNNFALKSFTDDTSAKVGATRRTVEQEVQIGTKIVPEVRDKLRDTPVADSKTDLLKLARMEPQEQRKLAAHVVSGAKTLKEARQRERAVAKQVPQELPPATDRCQLIHSDITDLPASVMAESVDWIITDPPYPREYLDTYTELAAFASHALKEGGSLICMVGQSYLPEIIKRMSNAGLSYQWTLAYLMPGGQAVQVWDRKVNTFWKPLLWFVRGKFSGDWIGDVCKSDTNDNDKRFHGWGQSESGMASIVERFTYPNQLICDPFCGGGTTGIVSLRLGRRFIGADSDARCLRTTAARIDESEVAA